jgi:hypothetical protein
LLALLAFAGCASKAVEGSADGSGGAPPYTVATSVDGGISLTGLSTSRAMQLCADISAANAAGLQATFCSAFNQSEAVNAARTYLQGNPGSSDASLQAACARYLMGLDVGSCPTFSGCDATRLAASPAA